MPRTHNPQLQARPGTIPGGSAGRKGGEAPHHINPAREYYPVHYAAAPGGSLYPSLVHAGVPHKSQEWWEERTSKTSAPQREEGRRKYLPLTTWHVPNSNSLLPSPH